MNKKLIIGAVVGGLLLFIWQFVAWSLVNLHSSSMQYTSEQEAILKVLDEKLEEGSYFLPNVAPGASAEETQKFRDNASGKPWAQISFHKNMRMDNMGLNMFRGFVSDFFAVLLLCWILMKIPGVDFTTTLLSSLAVGVIGYLTIHYLNSIWFENNTISALVDTLVSWGLVGVWLGWWLGRE